MRVDETIRAEFEALLSPAIYAQAAYYRSLGLRERIPNLPLMIAAILALLWRQIPFEHAGTRFTDRALVVWSEGKQRLDERKRKTYLKRLLNGFEHIQKRLNNRRYKQRSYVEQRLTKLREGNPTWELVETHLDGADGELQFGFRIGRQKLAEAQALDGHYVLATNASHLDAHQALRLFKGQDWSRETLPCGQRPITGLSAYISSPQLMYVD